MSRWMGACAAGLLSITIAACGTGPNESGSSGSQTTEAADAAEAKFPMTVDNCGQSVTLDKAPQRIVLVQGNDVPLLTAVGALDRVVARAGKFPPRLYSEQTMTKLRGISSMGGSETAAGTTPVSLEAILAHNPDLVMGVLTGSGVSRAALARSGVPYLASPSQDGCALDDPDFESMNQQIRQYGRVFGRPQQADMAISELQNKITRATQRGKDQSGSPSTAAAIYVPEGGRQVTVYGNDSMIDAQLDALGHRNIFGKRDFRRTEIAFEELLSRDPDYLVVLTLGDLEAATKAVKQLPGANKLTAIDQNRLLALNFRYTDPPTPFSVRGLEILANKLEASQ